MIWEASFCWDCTIVWKYLSCSKFISIILKCSNGGNPNKGHGDDVVTRIDMIIIMPNISRKHKILFENNVKFTPFQHRKY